MCMLRPPCLHPVAGTFVFLCAWVLILCLRYLCYRFLNLCNLALFYAAASPAYAPPARWDGEGGRGLGPIELGYVPHPARPDFFLLAEMSSCAAGQVERRGGIGPH